MLQARHELLGPGGQDAEVVVEVVAQQELAHLFLPDAEEERGQGHLAQAQVPAEGHGRRHVGARHHQRTGVALGPAVGARRSHLLGTGHAQVTQPRALEGEGHLGGQVGGEAEKRVHGQGPRAGAGSD